MSIFGGRKRVSGFSRKDARSTSNHLSLARNSSIASISFLVIEMTLVVDVLFRCALFINGLESIALQLFET